MAAPAIDQGPHGSRSVEWLDVWERKGRAEVVDLHQTNGYDFLDADSWHALVARVGRRLDLAAGMRVVECGCGAGAFLASLQREWPGLALTGVDYSAALVRRADEALEGDFFTGDLRDLSFLPAASFDRVLSFGAFQYLDSDDDARKALTEMARLATPAGSLYVGEISDLAKRDEALAIRAVSHAGQPKLSTADLDHLYLPKHLFLEAAGELGYDATIVDHADLGLDGYDATNYRYSVYFTPAAA